MGSNISRTVCVNQQPDYSFLTDGSISLAAMGAKGSSLGSADREAAERLKALWLAIPRERRPRQQAMADAWTGRRDANQSLISQYLNGHIALNYPAVLFFAKQLGVSPEAIRDDLPEQRLSDSVASPRLSQSARLDPQKIVITTRAINRILDRRHKGLTLDLTEQLDAELFSVAYAECESMPEPTEADMVAVVADLMLAREERRGREGEQVGGVDRSEGRKARTG